MNIDESVKAQMNFSDGPVEGTLEIVYWNGWYHSVCWIFTCDDFTTEMNNPFPTIDEAMKDFERFGERL